MFHYNMIQVIYMYTSLHTNMDSIETSETRG